MPSSAHPHRSGKAPLFIEGGQTAKGNQGGEFFSNSPSLRGAQTAPLLVEGAFGPMPSSALIICMRATVSKTVGSGFKSSWAAGPYFSPIAAIRASAQRSPSTAADVMPPA